LNLDLEQILMYVILEAKYYYVLLEFYIYTDKSNLKLMY